VLKASILSQPAAIGEAPLAETTLPPPPPSPRRSSIFSAASGAGVHCGAALPGATNGIRKSKTIAIPAVLSFEEPVEVNTTASQPLQRTRLQSFVDDPRFELFFGLAIITNAIFIGIQTDFVARHGSGKSFALEVVGMAYTLLFTVELAFKICSEGRRFFWGSSGVHWNVLDTIVVTTSIFEAAMTVVLKFGFQGSDPQSTSQFRILRIMRITRLIKVVRITRIIKFIRALRIMVHQLLSTLKALLWAMFLLALIIYLFAILFTQAFSLENPVQLDDLTMDSSKLLQRYWSTLPRSMFTLFQSITGGVSWEVVVLPLSDMGFASVTLFIAFIAFAQFAVLNVLTGVFCQNAIDSAQHDAELVTQAMLANKQVYVHQIRQIFRDFDQDESGSITIQEFIQHLSDESVKAYFESLELDTSDVETLFRLMDSDDGNEIELNEFIDGCLRLKGHAKGFDMAKLQYSQSAMSKKLAQFIVRTEEALHELHTHLKAANRTTALQNKDSDECVSLADRHTYQEEAATTEESEEQPSSGPSSKLRL